MVIFRIPQLQDAVGVKSFRLVLRYLDEDVSALPIRFVLNRLERYHIVPDANEWILYNGRNFKKQSCSSCYMECR